MTMDYLRIEYIEKLIEKRNEIFLGGNYNLLIHSVLNTIELCELIDFYLSLKSDTDIRKSIESNIYKRIANLNDCKTIFDQLLQQLDDSGVLRKTEDPKNLTVNSSYIKSNGEDFILQQFLLFEIYL